MPRAATSTASARLSVSTLYRIESFEVQVVIQLNRSNHLAERVPTAL